MLQWRATCTLAHPSRTSSNEETPEIKLQWVSSSDYPVPQYMVQGNQTNKESVVLVCKHRKLTQHNWLTFSWLLARCCWKYPPAFLCSVLRQIMRGSYSSIDEGWYSPVRVWGYAGVGGMVWRGVPDTLRIVHWFSHIPLLFNWPSWERRQKHTEIKFGWFRLVAKLQSKHNI